MGDYTGLRIKAVLKPEFIPVIQELYDVRHIDRDEYYISTWNKVAQDFPQYEFLKDWAIVYRCDFIPFGAICYLPWKDDDPEWAAGLVDNSWIFQCSLKNYESEIQTFIPLILDNICESYEGYYQFEYDDGPTHIRKPYD